MEYRHVFYSGRVQGVGFRYQVHRIAQSYAVSGFVRNLADGRVELFVEGPGPDLDLLATQIAETMQDNIRRTEATRGMATGRFHDFTIAPDA